MNSNSDSGLPKVQNRKGNFKMDKILNKPIASTDNIPVDSKGSHDIIMRAQEDFCAHWLLMANRLLELNSELRRNKDDCYLAHLKKPLEIHFELDDTVCGYSISSFQVDGVDVWKSRLGKDYRHYKVAANTEMPYGSKQEHLQKADEMLMNLHSSLADLLSSGVKGTVKRPFRRWCNFTDLPFAPIPMDSKCMKSSVFLREYENVFNIPEKTEFFSMQAALDSITKGNTGLIFSENQCKNYCGCIRMLYPYRNKYGEIEMFECVFFDFVNNRCLHIPVTLYRRSGTSVLYTFAMPQPKTQILYNLDLIEKADKLNTVVICDSSSIAEINQENAREGVVFTSWMCDDGHLEEVDLSPLLKAKEIAFLIVNHSGKSLEDMYIYTEKLTAELRNVKGFAERHFIFYQAQYKYQDYRMPYDPDAFPDAYRNSLGTLIEGSEQEIDEATFLSRVTKIHERQEQRECYFWNTDASCTESDMKSVNESGHTTLSYIIHPWILRGEVTGLYAKKNHGKSPLAYTLAIAATCYKKKGVVDLFPERTIMAVPEPTHRSHKVLFLDFELGQMRIDQTLKSIGGVYWPAPVKQKEAYVLSKENLIIVNMQAEEYRKYVGKDLSSPEYQQFLFDQIEDAKNKGIKGQPVDMVVIDTYNKFVGTESIKTHGNFTQITSRLRRMGIAVLLTGQLNADDNPRGFQQKLDDEYASLIIRQEYDTHAHSLEETPHFIYLRNFRGTLKESQLAEIKFTYPMGGKLTFLPETKDNKNLAESSRKEFVELYTKLGYSYPEIASMLGMDDKTLYGRYPVSSLKK